MYHNNITVDGVPYTITGNNVGFTSSFGTDFMLTNEMSLGLQVNISAASINKIKLSNYRFTLSDDDTENMSRVSIGLVIKYYK